MRKYHKNGLARRLLEFVHERHPWKWRQSAHINNLVSQAMCRKVFSTLAVDDVKETITDDTVQWIYNNSHKS